MKELTAAFQSEVFRPIVTLVVPGFFAVFNLGIIFWQRFPGLATFAEHHSGLATTTAVLTVVMIGLVCEDFGARLETFFDEQLTKETGYGQHAKEWFDYLRLAFEREPVGHRYLRTLVLRLKFELGMAVASVPFTVASFFIPAHCPWRIGLALAGVLALFVFFAEGKTTNKTLSELRREILKGQTDQRPDLA
jgi:hypothetical protein